MATFESNRAEFLADLDDAVAQGLSAAGEVVANKVRRTLSRQGTPTSRTGRRDLEIGNELLDSGARPTSKAGKRRKLLAQSVRDAGGLVDPPGGSPRLRTGTLRRSIRSSLREDRRAVRIGSGLSYARIHEVGGVIQHPGGTPFFIRDGEIRFVSKRSPFAARLPRTKPHPINIPARPYLRPALVGSKREIGQTFSNTVKRRMARWADK